MNAEIAVLGDEVDVGRAPVFPCSAVPLNYDENRRFN